jgi:hypothetical protein
MLKIHSHIHFSEGSDKILKKNPFTYLEIELVKKIFTHLNLNKYSQLLLVDKRWKRITKSLFPYISFKIVKFIANNYLVPFVKAVSALIKTNVSDENAKTSCTYNMFAMSVIFSGSNKVEQLAKFINENHRMIFSTHFNIKNQDIKVETVVDNLLMGPILVRCNENLSEEKNTSSNRKNMLLTYARPISNLFSIFVDPILKNCSYNDDIDVEKCKAITLFSVDMAWKNLDYDFNDSTINSLENEIVLKSKEINLNISNIYYIAVVMPNLNRVSLMEDKYSYYHAFAIEQFFSSMKKECMYRIYQSNIYKMTLLDYFQKMNYVDFSDKGCLNIKKLSNFFTDLKLLLTSSNKSRDSLSERCFGSLTSQFPAVFYDKQTQTLQGLSLRYRCHQFRPTDCLRNFTLFLKNQNIDIDIDLDQI